jgi:hypothetical protein
LGQPLVRFNAEATLQKLKDENFVFNPDNKKFKKLNPDIEDRPNLMPQEVEKVLGKVKKNRSGLELIDQVVDPSIKNLSEVKASVKKYLAERVSTRQDYLQAIAVAGLDVSDMQVILQKISIYQGNSFKLESAFRQLIRAYVAYKLPPNKANIVKFHQSTDGMINANRGRFFEAYGDLHFQEYQGAVKEPLLAIKAKSIQLKPDRVLVQGDEVVLIEYKHLMNKSSIKNDLDKIKAYYKAANNGTLVYPKNQPTKMIDRVEYVFSTKEAYDRNNDSFKKYRKYIQPRYMDKLGNLKP